MLCPFPRWEGQGPGFSRLVSAGWGVALKPLPITDWHSQCLSALAQISSGPYEGEGPPLQSKRSRRRMMGLQSPRKKGCHLGACTASSNPACPIATHPFTRNPGTSPAPTVCRIPPSVWEAQQEPHNILPLRSEHSRTFWHDANVLYQNVQLYSQ